MGCSPRASGRENRLPETPHRFPGCRSCTARGQKRRKKRKKKGEEFRLQKSFRGALGAKMVGLPQRTRRTECLLGNRGSAGGRSAVWGGRPAGKAAAPSASFPPSPTPSRCPPFGFSLALLAFSLWLWLHVLLEARFPGAGGCPCPEDPEGRNLRGWEQFVSRAWLARKLPGLPRRIGKGDLRCLSERARRPTGLSHWSSLGSASDGPATSRS